MVLQWCTTVSFLLVVSFFNKSVFTCDKHIYGLVFDFQATQTVGKVYKMEKKQDLGQFPLEFIEEKTCPMKFSLPDDKEPLKKEFTDCLTMFDTGALEKKEPSTIYPVLTGNDHIDADKPKTKEVMAELANILKSKNYGVSEKGYFQPFNKIKEAALMAIAAAYVGNAENIESINSTLGMGKTHLFMAHPQNDKIKTLKLVQNLTMELFKNKFDLNIVTVDCLGVEHFRSRYLYHIAKVAMAAGTTNNFESHCHPAISVDYYFKNMKTDCNKDMFDDKFPDKATVVGKPNLQQCFDLLLKVFCDGLPKGVPCFVKDPKDNPFLPADTKTPVNLGVPFPNLQKTFQAKDANDLSAKIEAACMSSNSAKIDLKTTDCFEAVYTMFAVSKFTHSLNFATIVRDNQTWHLGRMLTHSKDISVTMDKAGRKRKTIIGVMIFIVVMVIIIAGVVIYFTMFKR